MMASETLERSETWKPGGLGRVDLGKSRQRGSGGVQSGCTEPDLRSAEEARGRPWGETRRGGSQARGYPADQLWDLCVQQPRWGLEWGREGRQRCGSLRARPVIVSDSLRKQLRPGTHWPSQDGAGSCGRGSLKTPGTSQPQGAVTRQRLGPLWAG